MKDYAEIQGMKGELTTALEDLRKMAAAGVVRLLRLYEGSCCAGPGQPIPGSNQVMVFTCVGECCFLESGRIQPLIVLPPESGESHTLLCLTSQLTSGETLALQLGFPDAPKEAPYCLDKLTQLARPFLMWSRLALERQADENRSAELEVSNRPERPEMLAVLKAHEAEQEWLAYEIHDRVSQTLASAFQQLQIVEALSRSAPEIRHAAVRGSILIRETIREVRAILNDLHPPLLDDRGLEHLVEEELRQLQEEMACFTKLSVTHDVRPPSEIEVVLYRILHEALTNIRRHAHAKRVTVSLAYHQDEAQLQVEDDGVGFDVSSLLARGRVGGLMSMQRRAELAGGNCRFQSEPEKGTSVLVWIPLQKEGTS